MAKRLMILISILCLSYTVFADMDKKISINMKNADVRDVFNAIALISSTNIVMSKDVEGRVSVFLNDVKLIDAVKSVTANAGLTYEIVNGIVYIYKKSQSVASDITSSQVETYFYKPKYQNASSLEPILSNFLKSTGGNLIVDGNTGGFIITDTPNNLKYIKNILPQIDKPVKQIMIESKIVRVSKNGGTDLGIQWGFTYNQARTSANFPYTIGVGAGADLNRNFIVNLPISDTTKAALGGGVGITLGNISNTFILNAKLNALETKGDAKVVHSPKILTMNGLKAKLESGEEIRFRETKTNTNNTEETTIQKDEAKTILDIEPHILDNGLILLKISVELSEFDRTPGKEVDGIPAKNTNKAETTVTLKDGETLVIAGLKKESVYKNESAVPGLSKIPLLGALFRSKSSGDELNDLLIFVTPKLVDINSNTVAK